MYFTQCYISAPHSDVNYMGKTPFHVHPIKTFLPSSQNQCQFLISLRLHSSQSSNGNNDSLKTLAAISNPVFPSCNGEDKASLAVFKHPIKMTTIASKIWSNLTLKHSKTHSGTLSLGSFRCSMSRSWFIFSMLSRAFIKRLRVSVSVFNENERSFSCRSAVPVRIFCRMFIKTSLEQT